MGNHLKTIGQLKASGYKTKSIRDEMRHNLVALLENKKNIFPGILGYDETVIPQIENAIISGQDIIFLGERGQAKSRIMRALISLLDEEIPVIKGCEINDDPLDPVCSACREKLAREGDDTEIAWLPRNDRFGEKLATPDATMADLIGDVDPIKVAEGRYLSDELTIHYGLIPRTNRGIFAINELPDLAERLQVGLFNLMEERDIQIRGYRIRLPLDIFLVASANPEDYTNRGRIITPLKDRYGAQIRTHYPPTIQQEVSIMEMEKHKFDTDVVESFVPAYIKDIVAEITHLARQSPDVNQKSGVSVRVSIANYETVLSNSIRRAIILHEKLAVPRISDLTYIHSSTDGKIELESLEEVREGKVVDDLIRKGIANVFNRYYETEKFSEVVNPFNEGLEVEVSDMLASQSYQGILKKLPGMDHMLKIVGVPDKPEAAASAVEFILEGLYVNHLVKKTQVGNKVVYRQ
jgi:magnesium chelatase subunit I